MRAHAGAHEADLGDGVVDEEVLVADVVALRVQGLHRRRRTALRAGEGDVGATGGLGRHVLHDHVDVDLGLGERAEDLGGLARLVGHTHDGDLGVVHVGGDSGDDRLLHGGSFGYGLGDGIGGQDERAVELRERRAHVDRQVEAARVLHAAQVQDLRAHGRELEHLLVGDVRDLAGPRHHARVSAEDAVDVGVDLTDRRVESGGQGDGGGVGAAAAQRGDVLGLGRDALEPGDDGDRALVDRLADPSR